MVVVAKSRSSLHIEKCDFDELILNKIFYLVTFSCINLPLTVKYTSESLLLNKHFQILNCKTTEEYWLVVLSKELK